MSSQFAFIQLLAKCRENNATDPRDKIYGLLGLAPALVTELIEPSYDRSHPTSIHSDGAAADMQTELVYTLQPSWTIFSDNHPRGHTIMTTES